MTQFWTQIYHIVDWISILAMILFFIGLIIPRLVLPFIKIKTRGRSSLIYGMIVIFCCLVLFYLGPAGKNLAQIEDPMKKTNGPPDATNTDINHPWNDADYWIKQIKPLPKCMEAIAGPDQRSTIDLPDDVQGKQIHIVYAVPKDGIDNQRDTNGNLAMSVSGFENWLCNQTGGKYFRLDTFQGKLDISFMKLPLTADEMLKGVGLPAPLQRALKYTSNPLINPILMQFSLRLAQQGFKDEGNNKLYAVFYEGFGPKGMCAQSKENINTAVDFLQPNERYKYGCGTFVWEREDVYRPSYHDFTMGHELIHAMGAVPKCAPHATSSRHVSDTNNDIMFGHGDVPEDPNSPEVNKPIYGYGTYPDLDYNHDDYYNANIKGCPDLKDSPFLISKPD